MKRRDLLKKAGVTAGASVVLAGCTGSESPLEIITHRMSRGTYGNVAVVGTARNRSDSVIRYAQIEARFFDSGGTRLGSGMANINSLGPGRRWDFEAMYIGMDDDRVSSYEFDVTA